MATIRVPGNPTSLTDESVVRGFLSDRGVHYDRWPSSLLEPGVADGDILQAQHQWLKPYMDQNGYRTADVIRVTPETPNLSAIREKFNREHTHSEDEVRYFVEGEGAFWFHKESPVDEVFSVHCTAGDLLSVPAHTKHWFILGANPQVCAIRIFTDQAGWVPQYTDSGIEQRYL